MNFSRIYYSHEDEITATSIPFYSKDYYTVTATCYEPPSYENKHIRYFNCKRCGAVGQYGKCEYCGSADEGEPNEVL